MLEREVCIRPIASLSLALGRARGLAPCSLISRPSVCVVPPVLDPGLARAQLCKLITDETFESVAETAVRMDLSALVVACTQFAADSYVVRWGSP